MQLHQGVLSIIGRQPEAEESGSRRRYFMRERPAGAWTRRIALPGIVHDAEVHATLKDGVLRLRIPVPESAKPRQIQIASEYTADIPQTTTSTAAQETTAPSAVDGQTQGEPVGAATT